MNAMNTKPRVSVIMPNFNGFRFLREAIGSLQAQTLQAWELIMVDDASSDASVDFAEELARYDRRIRVVQFKINRGPAAARNTGIEASAGQWLAMFDSDDLMLPERLDTLCGRAEADGAAIVADNQLHFMDGGGKSKHFLPRHTPRRWIGFAEFINSNRLYSRTADLGYLKPFIHAETLKRLGVMYDERLRIGEDYHFLARLLAGGLSIRLEPRPLYLYRRHTQSISYRLCRDDILRLIAADDGLAGALVPSSAAAARALLRRRRSLETMLRYDDIVTSIKAGSYGRASALAIGAPPVWPLLTRPVRARARRLLMR
jgi:succinoglycan biosynthesis protein ExoO